MRGGGGVEEVGSEGKERGRIGEASGRHRGREGLRRRRRWGWGGIEESSG